MTTISPTTTPVQTNDWSAYKELLFVDQSLEYFVKHKNFPDTRLSTAYDNIQAKKISDAKTLLHEVAGDQQAELRVRLWAWQALRDLGEKPPVGIANEVQGIVLEVPAGEWLDTLAMYADGRARYLNGKSGAIVWETTEDSNIKNLVLNAIKEAKPVIAKAQMFQKHQPTNENILRASILTFGGVYVIEDDISKVARDKSHAMSGLFDACTQLFLALIDENDKAKNK